MNSSCYQLQVRVYVDLKILFYHFFVLFAINNNNIVDFLSEINVSNNLRVLLILKTIIDNVYGYNE